MPRGNKRMSKVNLEKVKGHIWEMLPEESIYSYECFRLYRDYPNRMKRTIQVVADEVGTTKEAMLRLSAQYLWVERAKAFDTYIEREELKAELDERRQMKKRHVQHSRAMETALMLGAKELLRRANLGITNIERMPLSELMEFVNKNAGSLTKIIDAERKANDLATEITDHKFSDGDTVIIKPKLTEKQQKQIEDIYEQKGDNKNSKD